MVLIHHGKVAQGKFILDTPSRYLVQLSKLEGKRIELILRQERKQRSIPENSYYWGVVIEILRTHCGYEPEEMHEALKEKFLSAPRDENGLIKVKSTTELSTIEFEDYLEKIKRFAVVDLGCFIPDPNSVEGFADNYRSVGE